MNKWIFITLILLLSPLLLGALFTTVENNNLMSWPSELLWGGGIEDSAIIGWYPVEQWEVDTCVHGQTNDFVITDQSDTGTFSPNALIVDTSLTIQGKQIDNENGQSMETELAWYIHPFNDTIEYRVKVKSNDVWIDLDPPFVGTASGITGDSQYRSWFSNKTITHARIETENSYLETELARG